MKLNRFRDSLAMRTSAWVVLGAGLLFLGTLTYLFHRTGIAVKREASNRAVQVLDNTALRVSGIMEDVELAANNLEWLVLRDIADPEAAVLYANQVVRNNPDLNSCSISFEPYHYPEKGLFYSIFAYRTEDGQIEWEQEGDEGYQYFYKNWYLLPKLLEKPCWTEPYDDAESDQDRKMGTHMMVSYCRPLYDPEGEFVGCISLDISLKWLSETISGVKPYPNSYSILVGHGGTYLVHPNPDKLFYQTLFTDGLINPDPEKYALGQSMRRQEEGMREMTIEGVKSYVYYKPIEINGWSLAIVCPESDIFAGLNRMRRQVGWNMLLGLLLLFPLLAWLIHKQLSPLRGLAIEADSIASGNLEHQLEPVERTDEIGVLNQSFRNMQSSLVRHIEDLTAATASRERMERELQIARNIQMAMVPHDFPSRKDIDLYASMMPAREVGGDLYDFCIVNEKLFFCLGDVSGKGVPASLLMAVARGMFRILAKQALQPAEIARQINEMSSEENEQMVFVTMFIASIDLSSGVMDFCNCGHNAPVMLSGKGGKPAFLDCKPNMAIGIQQGFVFEGQRIENVKGKPLFLYTDGLNEAENRQKEEFGNEKMLEVLGEDKFVDARTTVEKMCQAVALHVDDAEASDDLTMLCVKVS